MTIQEILRRTIDMLFFCTEPDCFSGINVIMILFILFMLSAFVFIFLCCAQSYYFNRHPEAKKRYIELTCGLDSHYMNQKLDYFDFQIAGLGNAALMSYVWRWRVKRGLKIRVSPLLGNIHRDQNYLKVIEEFPRLMKIQSICVCMVISGILCLGIASALIKHFQP
jgi:hypothetical protein